MSRKPETTFMNGVHKYLPPDLHHEKMYNPFRGGTADMWYSGLVNDLWIEYKFLDTMPTRADVDLVHGKEPVITFLQQDWLRGRFNEGRNVWVIVGCPKGGVIMRGTEWELMWSPDEFSNAVVDRRTLAQKIANFTMRAG